MIPKTYNVDDFQESDPEDSAGKQDEDSDTDSVEEEIEEERVRRRSLRWSIGDVSSLSSSSAVQSEGECIIEEWIAEEEAEDVSSLIDYSPEEAPSVTADGS